MRRWDFAIKRSIRWTAWSAIKMTGICTLDARQQSWTTLQTIFRRGFQLFDDVCSASDRTERKACVSNLEARPLQSRKPEFRPDRKCGGRSTGHPACRGCMVFWEAGKKPTIGEDLRPVEAADIMRINRMMITASLIALVLFLAVRCVLCILL